MDLFSLLENRCGWWRGDVRTPWPMDSFSTSQMSLKMQLQNQSGLEWLSLYSCSMMSIFLKHPKIKNQLKQFLNLVQWCIVYAAMHYVETWNDSTEKRQWRHLPDTMEQRCLSRLNLCADGLLGSAGMIRKRIRSCWEVPVGLCASGLFARLSRALRWKLLNC